MHALCKASLAMAITFLAVTPSMAFWDSIAVPEINGSAGISAIAAVIAVSLLAYQRICK
jgi:hypothetical protein